MVVLELEQRKAELFLAETSFNNCNIINTCCLNPYVRPIETCPISDGRLKILWISYTDFNVKKTLVVYHCFETIYKIANYNEPLSTQILSCEPKHHVDST